MFFVLFLGLGLGLVTHLVFLLFVFPDLSLNFFLLLLILLGSVKVIFCVVRHRCVPVQSKVESSREMDKSESES